MDEAISHTAQIERAKLQLQQLGLAPPTGIPTATIAPPAFGGKGELVPIVELASISDVKLLAEEATPHAIREIFNIGMGSGKNPAPVAVRLAALKEILDRGLGKASQHVEVDITHTDIIKRIQRSRGKIIEGEIVDEGPA